mmetsp:Transcript_46723/g.150150  ORF Transcript_46723/g.150150 Transcript_46723/m.150150 type:complete len:277 (-) Transcript_46723:346-1176(-)
MPPKPRDLSCLISEPMKLSCSNKTGSSMDTSSMTNVRVLSHRAAIAWLFLMRASIMRSGHRASLVPKKFMPAQLWTVVPPTLTAARPVGAVTATLPGWSFSISWTMYRNRKLLPVPAAPVMKRLSPLNARSAVARCSSVRQEAGITCGCKGCRSVGALSVRALFAAGGAAEEDEDTAAALPGAASQGEGCAPCGPLAPCGVAGRRCRPSPNLLQIERISAPNSSIFPCPMPGIALSACSVEGMVAAMATNALLLTTWKILRPFAVAVAVRHLFSSS